MVAGGETSRRTRQPVGLAISASGKRDEETGAATTASIELKLDGFGRMRAIALKARAQQITATYDALGSQLTFNYNSLGFPTAENLPAYFGTRSVKWTADTFGRRSQVSLWAGASQLFAQSYAYEADKGRLASINSWSGVNSDGINRTTGYAYHASSNEVQSIQNTWAGHTIQRTLDPNRDAVSTFTQTTGAYESIRATYTRDNLGRLATSSRDNTDNTTAEPLPLFRNYSSQEALAATYTYNARDELTAEDLKAKVNGNWQNDDKMGKNRLSTFSYDSAQNRTNGTELAVADTPVFNALNQPLTFRGVAVAYDFDGNLTSDGTWNYAYDAENRLKSSSKAGLTITYQYDYLGRRVEMNSGGFTKRFIWDGWNVIADMWTSGGIANTFVWGLDVSGTAGGAGGVGGLLIQYYNGRAFLPLQDGRGNIHGYLDTTTGKNAVAWDFTAYGQTVHERGGLSGVYGTQDFQFRYQSKMQDTSGHLLYFGHRFYHPGMGRFANRDPLGEDGGANLYGYVGNSPVNRWDLLGLTSDDKDFSNFRAADPPVLLSEFPVRPSEGDLALIAAQNAFDRSLTESFVNSLNNQLSTFVSHDTNRIVGDISAGRSGVANAPAPKKTEPWKPTKKNCDELRAQHPGSWGCPEPC